MGTKNFGIHHYMTKYLNENNDLIVVSWIQLDFGKWCRCFSIKEKKIEK